MTDNTEGLPHRDFSGDGLHRDFDDGRFVALNKGTWDNKDDGWVIQAGRGESFITLGLSDEAMVSIIMMFEALEERPEGADWVDGEWRGGEPC